MRSCLFPPFRSFVAFETESCSTWFCICLCRIHSMIKPITQSIWKFIMYKYWTIRAVLMIFSVTCLLFDVHLVQPLLKRIGIHRLSFSLILFHHYKRRMRLEIESINNIGYPLSRNNKYLLLSRINFAFRLLESCAKRPSNSKQHKKITQ